MSIARGALLLAVAAFSCPAAPAAGQEAPRTGWELAGVPALNYDADEGFGYGAILELYDHGGGDHRPYRFTVQPTLLLTTGGRRDFTLFFDAPGLLPGGWRVDAYLGSERQLAAPYYGTGNATLVDPGRSRSEADPYFYRFGRERRQAQASAQRSLRGTPLRLLLGAGLLHTRVDAVPRDSGTTLLELELGPGDPPASRSHFLRAGLVWDTRDRETGPSRGSWSELLVQRADRRLGSTHDYTRWTLTDRRYLSLGSPRLVAANRLVLQGVHGSAPFHELTTVQTSFKPQEGLGGAKTVRGLPKNRFVGEGLFLWNAELRWRAADFHALGRPAHLVLTGFVDSGRVWGGPVHPGEIVSELHHGWGGGTRLGIGENFVVAVDVGHSAEAAAPVYVGLGYLF